MSHRLVISFLVTVFLLLTEVSYSQKDTTKVSSQIDSTHTARKATILSVIVPGGGQIYNNFHRPETQKNRLWWKLPIIYGGLGTSAYFITQNQKSFNYYRNLRLDLLNGNTSILYNDEQLASIEAQYRQWRDMSVIAALAVYILNIVDANVEGTLLHFDDSDDLSLNITPFFPSIHNSTAGIKLSFKF